MMQNQGAPGPQQSGGMQIDQAIQILQHFKIGPQELPVVHHAATIVLEEMARGDQAQPPQQAPGPAGMQPPRPQPGNGLAGLGPMPPQQPMQPQAPRR